MLLQQSVHDVYVENYLASLSDCPRALTAYMLFKYKEHKQLVELEFNPLHYNSINDAADSLAATKFLSKATFLDCLKVDKRAVALEKFFEAEEKCRKTNLRLKGEIPPSYARYISIAARKIDIILGDIDPEELVNSCNWGPGATTAIKRRNATAPTKYQSETSISKMCHDFVAPWIDVAYPLWKVRERLTISGSSKIVTVPKNAKTDRTIAIEPGINLWFQKGIGSIIRRKLSRHGIDLAHQNHNQERARIGSKFNQLATIDFTSASDTISIECVRTLLPPRWFLVLSLLRSHVSDLDGKPVLLEKFSSMGNGFTFELETLIFYSLAIAICEANGINGSVSVYGDDVVLPSKAVDEYRTLCEFLGFSVNESKSYSSSPYRESCGDHYWNGVNIKPIYQKEPLNGKAAILKAANNVRRYAHRRNTFGCDHRFRSCWQFLTLSLGKRVPEISEGYGDLGLVLDLSDTKNVKKAKNGLEGFYTKLAAPIALSYWIEHEGLLLSKLKPIGGLQDFDPLKFLDPVGLGNNIPLPMRQRYAMVRILIPRWHDLGPWV